MRVRWRRMLAGAAIRFSARCFVCMRLRSLWNYCTPLSIGQAGLYLMIRSNNRTCFCRPPHSLLLTGALHWVHSVRSGSVNRRVDRSIGLQDRRLQH